MKIAIAALAASAALAITPMSAFAQHIDVGPGGAGIHSDRRDTDHTRSTVEEHHRDRPVVHDDHHGDRQERTVVEEHRR